MTDSTSPTQPLSDEIKKIVEDFFNRYPQLRGAGEGLIVCFRMIVNIFEKGGILYVCGNGGSFADAMHIKAELGKGFECKRSLKNPDLLTALKQTDIGRRMIDKLQASLPVMVLGESHSLRSAYANDCDPELVYAQDLLAWAERIKPGILLGISTSGNARNVIAAMALARACGITTISFTCEDGGRLSEVADIPWRVPGNSTAQVQENQVPLYHTLCRMIETHFYGSK